MTRDAYFEMCEALGSEPIEEEIPVEYTDLPSDIQIVLSIYNTLKDSWNGMSGTYMGKEHNGLIDILELYEIPKEERKHTLTYINAIDNIRSSIIAAKQAALKDRPPKPAH